MPLTFVTTSFTVYEPAAVYLNDGFCTVESTVPSSLKSHAQAVAPFVERSVNDTVSGMLPDVGVPEKAATGAFGFTTTYPVFTSSSVPPGPVTVSFTV